MTIRKSVIAIAVGTALSGGAAAQDDQERQQGQQQRSQAAGGQLQLDNLYVTRARSDKAFFVCQTGS
ncbi:MAG: hypothetical protein JXB36_19250, partial [Gammaproteobacteria bacterium]|nr:hypothetical protein [Gammaproteobacteria bacterium]